MTENVVDRKRHDAYVLSVEADKLRAAGDLPAAMAKMRQASQLDKTYSVRAELIAVQDVRSVRPSAAIRKIIVPAITANQFQLLAEPFWFSRDVGTTSHGISVGLVKFGGAVGLHASRQPLESAVEYFDWRSVGNRTGTLAYRTHLELEEVCNTWVKVLNTILPAWFATDSVGTREWPDA